MANPDHLAELKKGVDEWNRWRKAESRTRPDLSGANLASIRLANSPNRRRKRKDPNIPENWSRFELIDGSANPDLGSINFAHADLRGANASGANLIRATLNRANLSGADFCATCLVGANIKEANLASTELIGASLVGADLEYADLTNADLRGADLIRTNFTRTLLGGANLADARVGHTIFADVDLSAVTGLQSVFHEAPSSIGIDTVFKSHGKISHFFLRGCGVPENFIEHMASLLGTGIEFYSLFISYSSKDQKFAERLHADLQAQGVRCWFAPEDMPGGKKLHEEIDTAISMHDKLLLILSEHSMNSNWVRTEISKARKREIREGKRCLFPIRLCSFEELRDWECFDADTGTDSAREIREYFIPDFSNWKDHDAYNIAFDKLLNHLQSKS